MFDYYLLSHGLFGIVVVLHYNIDFLKIQHSNTDLDTGYHSNRQNAILVVFFFLSLFLKYSLGIFSNVIISLFRDFLRMKCHFFDSLIC